MFIDSPGKFVVKFPSNKRHHDSSKANNAWDGDEERVNFVPYGRVDITLFGKNHNCFFNLLRLNRTIDEQSDIANTEADNLDSIFQSQCVVYQNKFVNKSEDVERQKGRDRFGLCHAAKISFKL